MSSTTVNTIILRALASVLPAAYSAPIRNSAHDPVDPLVPPTSTILHGLVRLIIIVMAVGYATWIRHWLGVTYGVKPAFISYVPLVLGVSALGGPAAGIWATLLSILAADIFLIAPHGTLRIDSAGDRIGLVVFAAAGIAISFTAGSLRRLSIYRKLAAEQLRASQESLASERRQLTSAQRRLAAIVESTDDAIITEDLNGLVTTWNAGAQRMFGYTTGEAVGQPILRFAPPGREHELGEIRQRILHNEHVHNFETIRVARDGRNIHVSATISPIVDEHGVIVGTSRIVRDVTTLRGIERQLRQSQKMDAVGQLTGGIAHDFNNLLAIIVGSLEIQLPQIQDNPAALHPATRAHAAALRGADLTRRLLAFSSVDQSNSAPVQLTKCIRNIMALARPTLGREIETSLLLEDTLAPVIVDSNALENSILNLVLNARDAMPRG
ncbi:MAG: PAS domain S-box protein, partial [Acidobacteriota bacterium]